MKRVSAVVPDPAIGPQFKPFRSSVGEHVLVVRQTRIYDLESDGEHDAASALGMEALGEFLTRSLPPDASRLDPMSVVVTPAPQNLSLNVSSSCNLACTYCYAGRGKFNGEQTLPMTWEVARAAITRLLDSATSQSPVTIGFLGGEPFVNRRLIHHVVEYAANEGRVRGLDVRFSVTTNGTLLDEFDIELIRRHRFAVTVSLDGDQLTHERQRPRADGKTGGFAQLQKNILPLLDRPALAQVSARTTVTRNNMDLRAIFVAITGLGFHEVGFAPLKSDPKGLDALEGPDWSIYLTNLIMLARSELDRARRGHPLRLTNFAVALKQLHTGFCSPYPCGAGGGYFSVASNGDWYTCHRSIGNDQFKVGDNSVLDEQKRLAFLKQRHVHAQPACASCWARYLCAGSCHQEATLRTESFCGYVRGWLEYCLSAYCELGDCQASLFAASCSESPSH